MAKYKVVLKGFVDTSESGIQGFLARFGQTYNMDADKAKAWIKQAGNVLYRFGTREEAEKSRGFIESLGGVAEVVEEPDVAPAYPPAPPPPPGPQPGAPQYPGQPAGMPQGPGPVQPGAAYPQAPAPFPYAPPPPRVYKRMHDLSSIFSDTFDLYFKHLWPLAQVNIIPIIPVLIFNVIAFLAQSALNISPVFTKPGEFPEMSMGILVALILMSLLIMPLSIYLYIFARMATITAIEDILNGRSFQPVELLKSMDKMAPVRFIATYTLPLLLMLLLFVPMIALGVVAAIGVGNNSPPMTFAGVSGVIISALLAFPAIFYIFSMFLFALPVVTLEGEWMVEALTRSKDLSLGHRWRNFGIFFLVWLVFNIPSCCAGCIPVLGNALGPVVQAAVWPAGGISRMLLYYDMRVRRGEIGPEQPGAVQAQAQPPAPRPPGMTY